MIGFCRAMLCKCGVCHHAVYVCLSVMFVHSVKTNKRIFKFFFAVLVFYTKRDGNILTGTPLMGASNASGVGSNHDSEPISGML